MTQRDCEHGQLARSCFICELQAEVAALKSKLEDIEDAHGVVMDERCGADEVHCTCVPALRYEVAALKAKLEAVCEAGEAHPPLMVMLAVEILCNHVEPGWENSQSVVWAWIAEERAKRNALVSAREVK